MQTCDLKQTGYSELLSHIKPWTHRNWVTLGRSHKKKLQKISGNDYMGRKDVRSGRGILFKWGREFKRGQKFLHGKVTSHFFFFENALLFPNSHQQSNSKTAQTFRNNNNFIYMCVCMHVNICVCIYMYIYMSVCMHACICILCVCVSPPEDWKLWMLLKRFLKLLYVKNKAKNWKLA